MTLVSSLNIAQQALSVSQAAITVVSNNISNVDNKNYSKLSAELSDVINYSSIAGPIGQADSLSGVQLSQIKRYSNNYLQDYYWNENSIDSYLKEYSSVAANVEDVMNTLKSSGLSTAISSFYSAVNALNSDPTDASVRANYISTAQNVCAVFNSSYNTLNTIKNSLVGDPTQAGSITSSEIGSEADSINNLLEQLANVNDGIIKTNSAGISSSALMDERDSVIKNLSNYLNINVELNNNNTANVSLGNYELVGGSKVEGYISAATGTAANPATINITDKNGTVIYTNLNSQITGGSLGAILSITGSNAANFTISSVVDSLNTLASSFAKIINDIQDGDPNGDGSVALCIDRLTGKLTKANAPMFVNSTTSTTVGVTAGNIAVNSTIINDPDLVAAARISGAIYNNLVPPITWPNDIGNNSNTTLLSKSRSNTYSAAGENLDGQTIEGYLSTTVSDIGFSVKNIENSQTTQTNVINQIEAQLTSEKGVNLDEELSDMIKYQRAYQAAARIFNTCNDLMESLINLGK